MLKNIKRWLGLGRKASREPPAVATGRAMPRQASATKGTKRPSAPPKPAAKKPRRPVDVLDNPRLSLERPDEGFDPYNTGAFNRGQSWAEIVSAHRALVKEFHPDRFVDHPPEVVAQAEQEIKRINRAYAELRKLRAGEGTDRRSGDDRRQG